MEISAGDYHSLALKKDGTVVAWGSHNSQQCDVPTGLTDVVGISAGDSYSLVVKKGQQ
ncbi:RCC1 domain-containing protein [bacterium]|nr:RCC1 domain-containing protein [bacterium]